MLARVFTWTVSIHMQPQLITMPGAGEAALCSNDDHELQHSPLQLDLPTLPSETTQPVAVDEVALAILGCDPVVGTTGGKQAPARGPGPLPRSGTIGGLPYLLHEVCSMAQGLAPLACVAKERANTSCTLKFVDKNAWDAFGSLATPASL